MKMFSSAFARQSIAAMVLGLMAFGAVAQDFRIGFVNTDRILREATQAKAAQTKLEAEFSRREKDLQSQTKELKTASEKFDRESPTMADATRVTRQRQLVDLDRDLQRKQREFQEDLTLRKNEELQLVLERANRIIKQVAESEKYDLILQEAVYINPKHDITDKVLGGLNSAK